MMWTVLVARAGKFDPALLNVAFVFLLLGYGTKVGLAPLLARLLDSHAEGPTPISAVLCSLLLNVALYAWLRFKMLLAINPAAHGPGPLMLTMGSSPASSPRKAIKIHLQEDVLPAHGGVRKPRRKPSSEPIGDRLLGRTSDDIGRGPLQHHDMCRSCRHRRNDRHRRRAATNHDNPLAIVAQVFGPFLRMHDAAGKAFRAVPAGHVAFPYSYRGRESCRRIRACRRPDRNDKLPASVRRPPQRPHNLMAETNAAIDAVGFCGVGEITQNAGPSAIAFEIVPWTGTRSRTSTNPNPSECPDSERRTKCPRSRYALRGWRNSFLDALSEVAPAPIPARPGADDQNVEMRAARHSRVIVADARPQDCIAHIASPLGRAAARQQFYMNSRRLRHRCERRRSQFHVKGLRHEALILPSLRHLRT